MNSNIKVTFTAALIDMHTPGTPMLELPLQPTGLWCGDGAPSSASHHATKGGLLTANESQHRAANRHDPFAATHQVLSSRQRFDLELKY